MDLYSINFVNILYINLILVIVILGSLIQFIEPYVPVSIKQTFRYGKHSFKGEGNVLVSKMEVPKSWFKHFYVFAFLWSVGGWWITFQCFIQGKQVPSFVIQFLNILCTNTRPNNSKLQYHIVLSIS